MNSTSVIQDCVTFQGIHLKSKHEKFEKDTIPSHSHDLPIGFFDGLAQGNKCGGGGLGEMIKLTWNKHETNLCNLEST